MTSADRPLDKLLAHAENRRSGEFICASSAAEIHVYLQEGRVAWATDSTHSFTFAAHLQNTAGIDVDTFREVVEECRRDKLSLGETLVSWGLASWDAVRESLSHQISLAIGLLTVEDEEAQVLFLERAYRTYDEHLTFRIRDFVEPAAPAQKTSPPVPAGGPAAEADRESIASRLRSSIEGLAWVEVIDADRVVDGDPHAEESRLPPNLVRMTLADGADFAALRGARSCVVGLSLSGTRSVWCRIPADSTFGAVVAAIGTLVAGAARSRTCAPERPDVAAWTLGQADAPVNLAIHSFMLRAQDVLGAVVLAGDAVGPAVAGSGCSAIDPETCVDVARRRAKSFTEVSPSAGPEETDLAAIGFYLRTIVTGESQFWCFGAELAPSSGSTLWMFLDRRSSQGLGWACLSALTRALSECVAPVAPA